MGNDIAISVQGLSKAYTIAHAAGGGGGGGHTTMAEAVMGRLRRPFARPKRETFWALKDLSLEVERGSVVGVIGRNGAGKSTFLKVLSRITEPTGGRIDLYGRVGSLLEVGTGFHPELTGRENVYLNGQILGMRRRDIDRNFDAIVAFADIEKFLDTPVKRYSSGMYVRLAFAVAAHLDSDILIVDEVLAVGDAAFQQKCLGKMGDVAKSGRTVLFVSHNMGAITALCSEAIVLHQGRLALHGSTSDCVDHYTRITRHHFSSVWEREAGVDSAPLVVRSIGVNLKGEQPTHTLEVDLRLDSVSVHKPAFVAVDVLDSAGVTIMQAIPTLDRVVTDSEPIHELRVEIDLPPMVPGRYSLTVWAGSHYTETLDHVRETINFEIEHTPTLGRSFPHNPACGYIVPPSRLKVIADRTPASRPQGTIGNLPRAI